jgi:invasion protein IalB
MSTSKLITRTLASLALLAFLACGGDKGGDPNTPPDGATAPAITAQPQSQSVTAGQTATFQVTATGTAPLSYQWKKGGTTIALATSRVYTTPATVIGDDGASFTVTVTNSAGHATSNAAVLHVTSVQPTAPTITAQPQNQSVTVGQTATFQVTATGTAPLSYQWKKNGNAINLATSSSYTTPATALSDNGGTYSVTVTNSAGHADSNDAVLTVTSGTSAWDPHFTVNGDGGNYWISVTVDATAAQVWLKWNSAWHSMAEQGWTDGNGRPIFAYSADIPDGATLALKAQSTTGQLAQTQPFVFHYGAGGTPPLGISVAVSPASATLDIGTTQLFTATVSQTSNTAVTWSVQEGGGGTVSAAGLYTAPAAPGFYHVVATSVADPTMAASALVTVRPTTPPVISNLHVSKTDACSATLTWTTGWPCNARVSYQKSGGALMTRDALDYVSSRTFVLDLLEPSTAYTVKVVATDAFGTPSSEGSIVATTTSSSVADVTITLDPSTTKAISPYIYGRNFYGAGDPPHLTLNRAGGNRWTAYNWENNASNSGTDWGPYSNDDYLGGGTTPAEAVRSLIAADQTNNMASLMTIQMQGYAAADKNGLVDTSQSGYLTSRFKQVVYKKGSAFTASPSTTDANVYMDEFLWALKNKFTGDIFASNATLPTFVSLDNEPELWSSTHDDLQPALIDPEAYIQKTIDLTKALKAQSPGVKLFGPVHYGYNGIVNWQNSEGFSDSYWFTDKYLQEMKAASDSAGYRLLDVYDFHWYSEAQDSGGNRITGLTDANLSDDQVQAIVQSPRSLWDPTYTENSWVAENLGGPVQIATRLQAKIDLRWPGTGLAITEYDNGGDQHIAGTLAQADNLGVFADQGIFAACYWPMTDTYPYIMAAFRMYRGFDGASAHFGDTAIQATSSQIQKVSVHASLDSQVAGRVVFVAINRSTGFQEVLLSGQALAGTAHVYRITAESARAQQSASAEIQPVLVGQVPVSGTQLYITLPPLSVSTIEIR